MVTFKRIVEEEPQFPTVFVCKGKIQSDSFDKIQNPEYGQDENEKFLLNNGFNEDLQLSVLSQHPKIEAFDLVSSVGGFCSLFLGMSHLSFFEIYEIFYEVIKTMFRS